MKKFYILLVIGIFSCLFQVKAADSVMEVRYWDWGHTPFRDNYQYELLTLILEKTQAQYGQYSIRRITESFTTARVRRELSRGKLFNVQIGPWRPADVRGLDPALRVEIDIYKGLLGYRQLIIRRSDEKDFVKTKNLADLKKYSVGIGKGWVDADIFADNGFQVNSNANFDTLLPMLDVHRFDFVSLSVMEAPELMSRGGFGKSLVIADKPLLYMPLPFVFYVSIHEPLLAQRIKDGLIIVMEDGSFDSLFYKNFLPYIQFVQDRKENFLFLHNHQLPKNLQLKPVLLEE